MTRGLRVVLALVAVAAVAPQAGTASRSRSGGQQESGQQLPRFVDGESATLLPDGTWLLAGGRRRDGGASDAVRVWDPETNRVTVLPSTLARARSDHSATLLSDGKVLIVGGKDSRGSIHSTAELFDPASNKVEILAPLAGARASHTATLLTDGRVLIAGGLDEHGRPRSDASIWDPSSGQAVQPIYMRSARLGHTATLEDDGSVRIEGGRVPGDATPDAEVFYPETEAFVSGLPRSLTDDRLRLSGSLPVDGATDVAADSAVALRFSAPLSVRTITNATVTLTGPAGPVDTLVLPAEQGRLVFLKPRAPLAPATTYMVSVTGVRPAGLPGDTVQPIAISFTTKASNDAQTTAEEDETWRPDASSIVQGWRANKPPSPWQKLAPLQAPPGVTALSGQVLLLNGAPLVDVTLEIDGQQARTDKTGRFLLALSEAMRGRRELVIDGTTANRGGRTYGVFEFGLVIGAGRTNVLPFTIWMPRLDTVHAVTIPSPTTTATIVRTPLIPGLELHLAPNTVIRDRDGSPVRQVSITPIPVDRPPFPLPRDAQVPIYFTIQPGGAYVRVYGQPGVKGARLIYPNYTNQKPGETMDFWRYDPEEKGWDVYGQGAVSPDGRQVVPNAGVSIYEFTGAMISTLFSPPSWWPSFAGLFDADPVDLATGLFVYEKTDLFLPDVMPLALTRTYRPSDATSRSFGRGSRHPYDIHLWRPNTSTYENVDLILPDGKRIHYVCSNPEASLPDLRFEHAETPTAFYKSTFKWTGSGWDLTLQDGTVYEFGDNAPLQSIRDRFGNVTRLIRASGQVGNVLKIISPHSRWIALTYDGSNRIAQATDNLGRTVGYTYDASGRLWKVTDVAGGITEYTYDSAHQMLTIKDPRGITYLTNQYDGNGRVSQQTLADTGVYGFNYTLDGSGKVTQTDLTDPEGRVQRATFNASGFPLTITEAYGTSLARTTTRTYQSGTNFVTSVVDSLSRATAYAYDALGNLTSVVELAGTADAIPTTYTYEPAYNQVATVTDALNHTTTFAYDHLGRVTSVTDPLSHQTTFTYNVAGQPLTVTDALSKTTTFGYALGNLVSITSPLGQVESRFVDAAGRLVQVTDPKGLATRFEYNPFSQVTKIIDALNGETALTYDGNGNLLTLTDTRNKTTTWTYDEMDRVETRTDSLTRPESYAYDLLGNLTSWTDRKNQVTTYQYDDLNRQTFLGFGTTGAPPTYASTIATTYDAGDRPTDIVDSVAGTIERAYDLLNRLTEEVTPEGTITYAYDDAGRRASMTVAGQTPVSYSFDDADRLTGVTRGTASVTLAYDHADRRTSLTLPNGIMVEYGYDDNSRLTGLTYKQGPSTLGTITYAYDANSQRTSVGGTYARTGLPAAVTSAAYDDANQIATFGGTSFTYDDNGNLTSDGVRSYTWNARNQLASLTGPVNGSFAYDAMGRRRSKTIGGTTTQFLYDGLNPVQELASGTPTTNLLTGLRLDEFFTRTDSAGVWNYLTDALGSSVALTDGSGTVQTEYTYHPFGTTTTTGASTTNAHAFTGREADGTGLYYYRARFYHPMAQRFVSEDPLGFAAGDTVLSAYVSNNPVSFVDPSGLQLLELPPPCEPGQMPSKTVMTDWGYTCFEMKIGIMPFPPSGPLFGAAGGGGGRGTGRAANKQRPRPDAVGPHSTYRRGPNGEVTHYETYERPSSPRNPNLWEAVKRYDGSGRPHDGVPTPHVHEGGRVRPPMPDEIPRRPGGGH